MLITRDEMSDDGRRSEDRMIRNWGANLAEWERYSIDGEPLPLQVRFRWWRRRVRHRLRIRERPEPDLRDVTKD